MPLWLQVFFFLLLAGLGGALLLRLKSMDEALWQSRLIIQKRLQIYDRIAPDLNRVYCFIRLVGYWKDISPADLIDTKRRLDREVNISRHLLSEEFYRAHLEFMQLCFRTFTGPGEDAKIRGVVVHELGDRRVHTHYQWEEVYEYFFDPMDLPTDYQIDEAYMAVMTELRACMGLKN